MGHLVSRLDSSSSSRSSDSETERLNSSATSCSSGSSSCATPSVVHERVKALMADPRSPSGVPRTPILLEEASTNKKSIRPKVQSEDVAGMDKEEQAELDADDEVFKANDDADGSSTPVTSGIQRRMKDLMLDPRSPSALPRTPILVDSRNKTLGKSDDNGKGIEVKERKKCLTSDDSDKENLDNVGVTIGPCKDSTVVIEDADDDCFQKELERAPQPTGEDSFVI